MILCLNPACDPRGPVQTGVDGTGAAHPALRRPSRWVPGRAEGNQQRRVGWKRSYRSLSLTFILSLFSIAMLNEPPPPSLVFVSGPIQCLLSLHHSKEPAVGLSLSLSLFLSLSLSLLVSFSLSHSTDCVIHPIQREAISIGEGLEEKSFATLACSMGCMLHKRVMDI